MECIYCKKTYATPSSLKTHQLNTKSCIKIQKEQGIASQTKFVCSICNKNCSSKQRLEYHENIHKKDNLMDKMEELEFENRNLKEEFAFEMKIKDEKIKELEDSLEKNKQKKQKITNIKKVDQMTTIENQNNNINIYQVMSPEVVEDFFKKHYNLDTLLGGQKALARFVNEGFLKQEVPVYICGDRSRQKFYIMNDGQKTEDTDCESILELTSPGMPAVKKVYTEALFNDFPNDVTEDDIQDNYLDIVNLSEDRTEFKSELSKIVSEEPPKNNFKKMMDMMKYGILPNESKKKRQDELAEEPVRRPDILGVSPGKLMVYRDRYRKDGTIKGPALIMKRINESEEDRKEYVRFLSE
jgi:hypothetical protein